MGVARRITAQGAGRVAWLLAMLLVAGTGALGAGAIAGPNGRVVTAAGAGASVDWSRGAVLATAGSAGDPRAPNPELAAVKARRLATEVARGRLHRAVERVALVAGASLEASAVSAAIERARPVAVERGSDGSVRVTLALPLDALRWASFAPDAPIAGEPPAGPSALIVDASAHLDQPAVGIELVAGDERYRGPTLFFNRSQEAADQAGSGAPVVAAEKAGGGRIVLGASARDQVRLARDSRSLIIVVLK